MVGMGSTLPGGDLLAAGISVPFELLAERCRQPLNLADPILGAPFRGQTSAWIGGLCETSVEWKLGLYCGVGGWDAVWEILSGPEYQPEPYISDCEANARVGYKLGLGFEVEERDANHRPDPLVWGYELVTRSTS